MADLLKLEHVNKKYPKFELKDVSFSIPEGSITGFIGRNGAGKTTTLKGIMNLVHFDSGNVYVFDKNFRECENEAKQNIGFTLSELSYYPNKTIRKVVDVTKRFYKNFDDTKYEKLTKLFNLDVDKKIEQLSSGMKVKYSLAIALSYDAKLLILDEPTSGLDPISRDEILDIFESIVKKEGRAILFSTHITSDLDKVATDIVYIHDGSIVFTGKKKDFINAYQLVTGDSKLLNDELKQHLLSFKEKDKKFEALIDINEKENLKKYKLTYKSPDLEEVMVYLERGKDHEEFTL